VKLKDEGLTTKGLAEPTRGVKNKEITSPKKIKPSFLDTFEKSPNSQALDLLRWPPLFLTKYAEDESFWILP